MQHAFCEVWTRRKTHEEAWKKEVRRRALDLEEGRTTGSPWVEARERLEHVAKTGC